VLNLAGDGYSGSFLPVPPGVCSARIDDVSRRDTWTLVPGHEPKERWLHTRISEALENALKREAQRRRQPVSLLVRNVLEGALDLVEDIVETSLAASRVGRRRRPNGRASNLDDVYGWTELVRTRGAGRVPCSVDLAAGDGAWRGLRERPAPPVFLCRACIGRLRRSTHNEEDSP